MTRTKPIDKNKAAAKSNSASQVRRHELHFIPTDRHRSWHYLYVCPPGQRIDGMANERLGSVGKEILGLRGFGAGRIGFGLCKAAPRLFRNI